MMEIWKSIPGYEGYYEASDLGRIRSIERVITQVSAKGNIYHRTMKGSIVKPSLDSKKHYKLVHLAKVSVQTCLVHLLVLRAFIGEPSIGYQGCHNDGDCKNNLLTNLRWDTRLANEDDKKAHGTVPKGETHYAATLTNDQVLSIKRDLLEYKGKHYGRLKAIGNNYGVTSKLIGHIASGNRWQHLT
jgi:NUMOD4 motif